MVLPEDLCERLSALAEEDSRTVSNMAKVLIQQGVERLERQRRAEPGGTPPAPAGTEGFRAELERQGEAQPKRLRGAPRRVRLQRPYR